MSSVCVPDASYFATPEFLSLSLHCLSLIEIPLHLFGAWIIMFRTPSSMSSVKWPMINLHFWSSILDISISLLTIPFVLFPAVAGFPLGILKFVSHSTVAAQGHVIVTLIGLVCVAILTVFETRYFMMSQNNYVWRKLRFPYLCGIYVIACTFLIPFSLMIPDQMLAASIVFERLSCLPDYVYKTPLFVYTLDATPIFIMILCLLVVTIITIIGFVCLTVRNLLRLTRKRSVSSKTLNLQKLFLFGLVVQTTIPFSVVFCPIAYLAVTLPQGYFNQAMNNCTFIAFACHGLFSTTSMLVMHQPYRAAALGVLLPCCRNNVADNGILRRCRCGKQRGNFDDIWNIDC